MPMASVITAIDVNPGLLKNIRNANRIQPAPNSIIKIPEYAICNGSPVGDFIPGEPDWKIRSGMVEVRTGDGFRQMTAVCPLKPSFYSDTFTFPKDFTVEI